MTTVPASLDVAGRGRVAAARSGNEASIHRLTVAELESWQRYLAEGAGAEPPAVDEMRVGLRRLMRIPSGKRGAHARRHPLPVSGRDGCRLPAMIRSESEALHAQQLLDWLARLEWAQPQEYAWLLDKWLYASDVQQGSMGLRGAEEVRRARALSSDEWVVPDIFASRISASRQLTAARAGWCLQIRLRKSPLTPRDRSGRMRTATVVSACGSDSKHSPWAGRTTRVVRWILTWLAVRRGLVHDYDGVGVYRTAHPSDDRVRRGEAKSRQHVDHDGSSNPTEVQQDPS